MTTLQNLFSWVLCILLASHDSCLENPMDRGAYGVAKSWIRLSDFTFTFNFYALEKEMATHSRVLAWRIPGTGEPGGLLSVGSHRVGHDWSDLAAAAARRHELCSLLTVWTLSESLLFKSKSKGCRLLTRCKNSSPAAWVIIRALSLCHAQKPSCL